MLTRSQHTIQYINSQLDTIGFVSKPNLFPCTPHLYQTLHEHVDDFGNAIFNYNELNTEEDYKRSQVPLDELCTTDYEVRCFILRINTYLQRQFPKHRPNAWVVLKSIEGCQRQAIHTDYPLSAPTHVQDTQVDELETDIDSKQRRPIPINALVALENNTQIHVWPTSHRLLRNQLQPDVTIQKNHSSDEYGRSLII